MRIGISREDETVKVTPNSSGEDHWNLEFTIDGKEKFSKKYLIAVKMDLKRVFIKIILKNLTKKFTKNYYKESYTVAKILDLLNEEIKTWDKKFNIKLKWQNGYLKRDESDFRIHIYYDDFWLMDLTLSATYHEITNIAISAKEVDLINRELGFKK